MPITTSDSIKGRKPFRCDVCRKETPILVDRVDRRRCCLDCIPAKDRAVFEGMVFEDRTFEDDDDEEAAVLEPER